MPVMAMAMNMPASTCLSHQDLASGSWPQTADRPRASICVRLAAKDKSSLCSRKPTHTTKPSSMPAVCSVSVNTIVRTPPSTV